MFPSVVEVGREVIIVESAVLSSGWEVVTGDTSAGRYNGESERREYDVNVKLYNQDCSMTF